MFLNPDNELLTSLTPILHKIQDYYSPKLVFYLYIEDAITPKLAMDLYLNRNNILPDCDKCKQHGLVVIIDSYGGNLNAAYNITKLLRGCCKRLTVIVPRIAKSAATLICLAADEIAMSQIAELGPLDPQIRRPGETGFRSVLDEFTAFEALQHETFASMDVLMQFLIQATYMDVKDLLQPTVKLVSELMKPVYAQINPLVHGSHMRTMAISKEYARRVMKQWVTYISEENAEIIAEWFSRGYPSHGYIIDKIELDNRGLNARDLSPEEEVLFVPLIQRSHEITLVGTYSEAVREAVSSREQAAPTSEKVRRRKKDV